MADKIYKVIGVKYIVASSKFDAASELLVTKEPEYDDVITEEVETYIFPPFEKQKKLHSKGIPSNDKKAILELCLSLKGDKKYPDRAKKASHGDLLDLLLRMGYQVSENQEKIV